MKLKTLLEIYAATAAVICLNFLAIPGFWIHLYGAQADAQAEFLYRLIAALFGGLAVMAWSGRAAEAPATREAMVRGLVVTNGLAALVAVLGAASNVYNQFAWGPAAMFAAFTLALLGATPTSPPSRTPS